MHPRRGLPPRPPLPANPLLSNYPGNAGSQQKSVNVGAMAAQALTSSLANPYGPMSSYPSYTNANYHSYFTQAPRPLTTAQGYTISSTYVPSTESPSTPQSRSWPPSQRPNTSANRAARPCAEGAFSAPGDNKCTYNGCLFTGSKNTVEIHMMDRHLIFPPGWKKKQNDWDADPSLKGKPVPIPGTGVTLDTPEAIAAWIAERKKRWPSKQHVEDKRRKAQEAADRGEIDPSELTLKTKRRRLDEDSLEHRSRGRGRGSARGRGRGNSECNYGRSDTGWRGRGQARGSMPSLRPMQTASRTLQSLDRAAASSEEDTTSEESGSDMDPVKDALSSKVDPGLHGPKANPDQDIQHITKDDPPATPDLSSTRMCRPLRRRKPMPQPRSAPQNPFTRPSLLRNLLLPEIRHTVSNLSQAIHFLVDNDFLEGVELKPGDADSQQIKVLKSASLADISTDA
ncbi:nuclear fragile X mental retardation-interacting protein 1-domain-containing protein [Gautieria morchelliformis]|nr:nuclear fragile X mental retardation-interacting protein 1-domain-containing protein [Gautieria morchelliformis]